MTDRPVHTESGDDEPTQSPDTGTSSFILPDSYPVRSDSKRFHLLGVELKQFAHAARSVHTQPDDEMRDDWLTTLRNTDRKIDEMIQNGVGSLLGPDIENPAAWLLKLTTTLSSVRHDAEQKRRPDDLPARLTWLDEAVAELIAIRRLRLMRQKSIPTVSNAELRSIDLNALRNEWYAFTDRCEWLIASVESLFEAGKSAAESIDHPAATVLEIVSQCREPAVAECRNRALDHYREARKLLESIRARLRYGRVELIDKPLVLRKELSALWKTVQDLWQNQFADDGIIDNPEALRIWCNTVLKRVSRDLMGFESQGETVFDRGLVLPAIPQSPAGHSPPAAADNSSDVIRMKGSPKEQCLRGIAMKEKKGIRWNRKTACCALEKMQEAEPVYFDLLTTPDLERIAGGSRHTFLKSGGPLPKAVLENQTKKRKPKRPNTVGLTDGVLAREPTEQGDPVAELLEKEDLQLAEELRKHEIARLAKEQCDDDTRFIKKTL